MSSIRKLKNGRYQADYSSKRRGVARTKHTADTRKEAEAWLEAVKRDATARLLGHQRRRLFGEALAKYLREESPKKLTHVEDLSNAAALRWPVWDAETRRFVRLEDAALEETPAVLAKWTTDLREVERRRYLGNQLYQLRRKLDGRHAWFLQPSPNEGDRPEPRREVTDAAMLARLNKKPGRGPFSTGTLRVRQLLVSVVLSCAWRHWSTPGDVWLDRDITGKIRLEAAAASNDQFADYETLLALIIAAPIGFDAAILGAAMIGWRRANILGGHKKHRPIPPLNWDHVVFPVYSEDPITGARVEVQPGYYWVDRPDTKTKKPLAQPMSQLIEQLFQLQWDARNGPHVFHHADGSPFSEFKSIWATTKRLAGVAPTFRWHNLRHTFASLLIQAGADPAHVQQLGGWSDRRSMDIYTHLQLKHLSATTNISRRPQ